MRGWAKILFQNPDVATSNSALFPRNDQDNRFIRIFRRVIGENLDEFKFLGVKGHTFGSHLCRKRGITLLSTCCTVSPLMDSICLRAG